MKVIKKLVLSSLLAIVVPASVQALDEYESPGIRAYTGSVLSNIVYIPAKAVFAASGLVLSSAAYILTLGSESITRSIADPTLGGTYVITPAMIEGQEDVEFVGPIT